MKKLILTLSCLAFSIAHADSNEKAIELMNVLEIRKNIDASMEQIMTFTDQMIAAQGLSPEIEASAKKMSKDSLKATLEIMEEMKWESMFAEIYANVFSEEEIQGLIDFYHTPLGIKLLQKQPELMAATMQKMQGEMGKMMPKIQQATMEAIQKAKAAELNTVETNL